MGTGAWIVLGIIFLVSIVGNDLLELIPSWSGGTISIRVLLRTVVAAVPLGIALYSLSVATRRAKNAEAREESRRKESESQRIETLQFRMQNELSATLEATVKRLFQREVHSNIRANVMLIRKGRLRPVCAWNMRAYDDRSLEFAKGQGVCGVVWKLATEGPVNKHWTPQYSAIKSMSRPRLKKLYRLNADQLEKTRHILWILSVPLFSQKDNNLTFVGVLNLDGVNAPLKDPRNLSVDKWDNVTGAAKLIVQEMEKMGTVVEGGEVDPNRPLW